MEFDSPRGRFRFDPKTHNVIQPFIYVREVREVYGGLNNVPIDKVADVRDPGTGCTLPGLIEGGSRAPGTRLSAVPSADLFAQALNGLAYGVLLFLLSVGLTLIFGMLDVVNLAHGSFYMLGAYAGAHPHRGHRQFLAGPAAGPARGGPHRGAGGGTCLRPLYRRPPLDQVLLTFGFIYLFEDLVKWIWGGRIRSIPPPDLFSGSVTIWGATIPSYRLFVIVFGLVMAVAALAPDRAHAPGRDHPRGRLRRRDDGRARHQHQPRVHGRVRLRRRARRAVRRHRGADPVRATRPWAWPS